MDRLTGSAEPPKVPGPEIRCSTGRTCLRCQGPATVGSRLGGAAKAVAYLASAATAVAVGGYAASTLGVVIAGLLVVITIPIVGFTRNQMILTNKGRDMAKTVDDVLFLKKSDAAAFAQTFAAVFHGFPKAQIFRAQRSLSAPHTIDPQPRPLASPESWPNADAITPERPERDATHVTNTDARRQVHPTYASVGQGSHHGHTVLRNGRNSEELLVNNFWQSLIPAERRTLMALANVRTFPAGAVLRREDEASCHVMVVWSGWTKVYVEAEGGKRAIATRGPGELIGERAALLVRSRSATVIAVGAVQALVIATEDFRAFLGDYPRVLAVLEGQVYGRLTEDHRPWLCHRATGIGRRLAGRTSSLSWAGQNCSILFSDIAAFGAHSRDDEDRRTVRNVFYRILQDAFESSNVPWSGCYREDRGDGALIVIPAQIPASSVVDPMLARLTAALRRHNHQASEAIRIQLRLALHVGPVEPDSEGVSGEAVIFTARLLDAPALKKELAKSAADLGFIASEFVYESVLKHGPGYVNPASYQQVRFQAKESKITAWMYLPGTGKSI